MKSPIRFALLVCALSSFVWTQCPTPAYSDQMRPLPPNSNVFVTVDTDGSGISVPGFISITPDPGNPAPKFTLNTQTPTGSTGAMDLVNATMNWNSQNGANGTGVSFFQGATNPGPSWIISPTWPKANLTYFDTSGHQQTLTVDFSGSSSSTVAESTWLPDYDANGNLLPTSAGGVTLINTNGTYSVAGAGTFPVWSPNSPNFDNALTQVGEHETGHGFLLGDQTGVAGDIMSLWGASSSNPGGATNNQDGHASSTITTCDNNEIKNNPTGPYKPPPPPPSGGGHHSSGCPPDNNNCSPIILDVEGEGFHLTSAEAGVMFDISGNGQPVQIAWTNPDFHNAFLALPGPDGLVHNGKELFGNFTPQPPSDHPNGFMALAQYDKPENGGNGDGIIDARDEVFPRLRLWIDENHDGICQPNELHRLPELGVYSLAFNYFESRRTDEFGNQFRYKAIVNPGERHDFRDELPHGGDEMGRWAYDVFFVTIK